MNTWQNSFSDYLSIRNRFDLKRRDLLADYAGISRRRPNAAFATAIRNRSLEFLDVLSMEATDNQLLWNDLRSAVVYAYSSAGINGVKERLFGKANGRSYSPKPIEDAARLLLLASIDERDARIGAWLLSAVNKVRPAEKKNRKARLLEVQYALLNGKTKHAADLLAKWKDIRNLEYSYLEAELNSPFREDSSSGVSDGLVDNWLTSFNKVFLENDLWPVSLLPNADVPPFDALTVSRGKMGDDHPAVSYTHLTLPTKA